MENSTWFWIWLETKWRACRVRWDPNHRSSNSRCKTESRRAPMTRTWFRLTTSRATPTYPLTMLAFGWKSCNGNLTEKQRSWAHGGTLAGSIRPCNAGPNGKAPCKWMDPERAKTKPGSRKWQPAKTASYPLEEQTHSLPRTRLLPPWLCSIFCFEKLNETKQ